MRTYLDYNATAPIHPQARAAMHEALSFHNASAIYEEGRMARAAIEIARHKIIDLCKGDKTSDVVFTSGGTEACNLAFGLHKEENPPSYKMTRIIVGATEHVAVLQTAKAQSTPPEILPVTSSGISAGIIDKGALAKMLEDDPTPALVCVQAANNETGIIQPIAEIAELVHCHNGLLFCDGVQAAGKIEIDIATWGCDALALSAHKIGGAMGVGALVMRKGLRVAPHIIGGGQELGLRAGTENVAGIVAFGVAFGVAAQQYPHQKWRDDMEASLREMAPHITIFGADVPRLPNTTCFSLGGMTAETLLMKLDLAGVAISSGAACSSGKVEQSHVLAAMGIDAVQSASALRVSFGWQTQEADIHRFLDIFRSFIEQQKAA
ncbi:MAG: cysteine desulfurase [Alphaproteobacteria bacterium]|nr:cysteine desulfurase [Alphaproteobacteria bacterium]